MLTNNDYEEHDDYSAKDFDDNTALIVDDRCRGMATARPTMTWCNSPLSQLPSTLTDGTFTLAASDPTAVRFFDDQGQELTSLSVNLANPTGYLAGVMTGDVDVWMEGLHKSSDLIIKAGYTDPAGNEIARDTVHMLLAEWNFVDTNTQPVKFGESEVEDSLLDRGMGARDVNLSDTAPFKIQVDGVTDAQSLEVNFTNESGETFPDDLIPSGGRMTSADFTNLYFAFDENEPALTTSQQSLIKTTLQRNVIHNPTTQATTQFAMDRQGRILRTQPKVWLEHLSDARSPVRGYRATGAVPSGWHRIHAYYHPGNHSS